MNGTSESRHVPFRVLYSITVVAPLAPSGYQPRESKWETRMPVVIASSFADPKDVAAYRAAIAEGKSE